MRKRGEQEAGGARLPLLEHCDTAGRPSLWNPHPLALRAYVAVSQHGECRRFEFGVASLRVCVRRRAAAGMTVLQDQEQGRSRSSSTISLPPLSSIHGGGAADEAFLAARKAWNLRPSSSLGMPYADQNSSPLASPRASPLARKRGIRASYVKLRSPVPADKGTGSVHEAVSPHQKSKALLQSSSSSSLLSGGNPWGPALYHMRTSKGPAQASPTLMRPRTAPRPSNPLRRQSRMDASLVSNADDPAEAIDGGAVSMAIQRTDATDESDHFSMKSPAFPPSHAKFKRMTSVSSFASRFAAGGEQSRAQALRSSTWT